MRLFQKFVFVPATFLSVFMTSIVPNLNANSVGQTQSTSPVSISFGGETAEAAWLDAADWIKANAASIYSASLSPFMRQTYMAELSASEVDSIRNQYRGSADNVMFSRALVNNRIPGAYAAWDYTYLRWAWAGRVENGKYNIYRRYPNNIADRIDALRRK